MKKSLILAASLMLLTAAPMAQAGLSTYYIGHDTAAGTNAGHLTLLRAHGNHFHRLGTFGGADGRIPEAYVGGTLRLTPGSGAFDGRYVSGEYHISGDVASEYSDLEMRSISTLVGFPDGTEEATLVNGGLRYTGSLVGSNVALELVSISAGLSVANAATGDAILPNVGDRYAIGAGGTFDPFTPLFFTNLGALSGTSYSATFKLVDLNGLLGDSGNFVYELQAAAVPEPSTLASLGLGIVGAVGYRLRRRSAR